MARKPVNIDNTDIINLISNYDHISECTGWIRDCIESAATWGHSNRSSPSAMFAALRTLPCISFESVKRFVNIKSQTIDDRIFSDRHVYAFMNRLISARKCIEFYYEKREEGRLSDLLFVDSCESDDFMYADGLLWSQVFTRNTVSNHVNAY